MRKIFLSLLLLITLSACNLVQIEIEPTATLLPLPLEVATSTSAPTSTPASSPTPAPALVKPIAIVTDFTPGQSDIAIINSDGTEYIQLTTYGFNLNPVLSPNGQYIAYRSVPASITSLPDWGARWAEGNFNIWVVAADGSQAWKLTDSELPRSVPAWSPDSTKVIFSEAPAGRIIEVDFVTGTQREWLAQDGRDPRYQRHGQGIGYISTAGSLIALNADGFTQTLVDVAALPPATTMYDFEWLMDRDSTVVYTLADTSEQIANIGVGIKYSAWLLASPGSPVLLAEGAHHIQPSPSGQYLAVQMGSGYGDACMVDLRQGFLASARTTPWPALSTDDFAERPMGESFYPLSAVTWISDHLALAQFGVTCAPDTSTQGLYLLDVLNQDMKFIRPLETR